MAQTNDVGARVRKTIQDHLGIEAERVTDEAKLVDDLRADSLDCVELLMSLEEEFDIEISDEEAEAAQTVASVIQMVEGKVAS